MNSTPHMLIRLIPVAPYPTILFALSFHDLHESLPTPLSWSNQLHALAQDSLEAPRNVHALDKAAAVPCLLQEITFDISTSSVSCQFIDGAVEQWPLMGASLLKALDSVLNDVNESALELEREKNREKEQAMMEQQRRRAETLNSPPSSLKGTRHKKQRSLLMSLIGSLVPSSSASQPPPPPPPPPLLPSPPPTPITTTTPGVPTTLSHRSLRRRARSTLVDVFRRHALSEITRRLPSGGYYTWIVNSMLRTAAQRITSLIENAGGRIPHSSNPTNLIDYFAITAITLPHSDDDDDDDDDTDTDGSSVHTPSSAHLMNTIPTFVNSITTTNNDDKLPSPITDNHTATKRSHRISKPTRTSPPPPPSASASNPAAHTHQYLSTEEHAEYTHLTKLMERLHHLSLIAQSRQEHVESEMRHRDSVLEVRSRRRAWLNKALGGGSRRTVVLMGMAAPFKSSPLARAGCCWTGEEYEYVGVGVEVGSERGDGGDDGEEVGRLGLRMGMMGMGMGMEGEEFGEFETTMGVRRVGKLVGFGDSKLFPVTEEPEDQQFEDDGGAMIMGGRQFKVELGFDLESGHGHGHPWNREVEQYDHDDEREREEGYDDGDVLVDDDDVEDQDNMERGIGRGIRVALEIERPRLRPRVRTRTSSMHRSRLKMETGFGTTTTTTTGTGTARMVPTRPLLAHSSLLCQPLRRRDDFRGGGGGGGMKLLLPQEFNNNNNNDEVGDGDGAVVQVQMGQMENDDGEHVRVHHLGAYLDADRLVDYDDDGDDVDVDDDDDDFGVCRRRLGYSRSNEWVPGYHASAVGGRSAAPTAAAGGTATTATATTPTTTTPIPTPTIPSTTPSTTPSTPSTLSESGSLETHNDDDNEEFTLAMDIPINTVRAQDRTRNVLFVRGGGYSKRGGYRGFGGSGGGGGGGGGGQRGGADGGGSSRGGGMKSFVPSSSSKNGLRGFFDFGGGVRRGGVEPGVEVEVVGMRTRFGGESGEEGGGSGGPGLPQFVVPECR